MTLKVFNFIVYATFTYSVSGVGRMSFLYWIDVVLSYREYLFFFFHI